MENFDLTKAISEANDLKGLLEKEFESLKKQDINGFEKLQSRKAEILTFLSDDRLSDICLLYTSPSPRDLDLSRMPSSA